jgi:hypothetical protein
MYVQGIENARLFIKKDTDDVPHDGKYHLARNGEIVYSHSNLKTIQKKYAEILGTIEYEKPKIPPPKSNDLHQMATRSWFIALRLQ